MSGFLDALRSGRVLLMDGAMGTELMRAGLRSDENAAAWNLLYPDKVRAIHQAYLAAGAEVLLTNTFLIHAPSFDESVARAGLSCDVWSRWEHALDLIGRDAPYRLAAVGPVAGAITQREFDNLRRFFIPNKCGRLFSHPECCHVPDAALLETCSSPRVRFALKRLRGNEPLRPLLLSLTYLRNDVGELVTFSGHSPEWFAQRAKDYGIAALGVNCGRDIGMDEIIEIIRRYRRVTDLPLFARPNAGTPKQKGKRWVYPHTPEVMAARLAELLEAGVSMIGGCCGTTPDHIAAFRPIIDAWHRKN